MIKAIEGNVTDLQGFKNETTKQREEREQADQMQAKQDKWSQDTDNAWSEHKFDELLGRLPEEDRAEVSTLMRQMMMNAAIGSRGQLPMSQVGGILHGRMSRMMDGLIKAYVAGKKTPPGGGGGGPVGEVKKVHDFGSEEMTESVKSRLGTEEV